MPEAETKAAARVPSLDLTPAPRRRRMTLLGPRHPPPSSAGGG
jgi:hypothetical protein